MVVFGHVATSKESPAAINGGAVCDLRQQVFCILWIFDAKFLASFFCLGFNIGMLVIRAKNIGLAGFAAVFNQHGSFKRRHRRVLCVSGVVRVCLIYIDL